MIRSDVGNETAAAVEKTAPEVAAGTKKPEPKPESNDITDDEFEELLDALGKGEKSRIDSCADGKEAALQNDEITDDEFEALLDKFHGPATEEKPSNKIHGSPQKETTSDEITDEEFEALLDKLQGSKNSEPTDEAVAKPEEIAPAVNQVKTEAPSAPKQNAHKETSQQTDTTVRVDTKRLDEIMNLVGELVLVRNRLSTLETTCNDEEMAKVVSNLDVVTSDLQAAAMKTRMQPIKKVFGRFPRVVRDLARSLKKEVNLELIGEETDLDKNLVDALADPLVHLVRNAVDHGIEMPDVREKAGKPRTGTVVLGAQQEGDHILLTIEDDGAGMDAERLRKKALEKGLLDPEVLARLDEKECFNLIFFPGFSTKDQISDVSGRGVGMDVVKNSIAQLNGAIEISSELGKGSRLSIKVPLTLAIMPTLMIMLKNQIFALPLVNVSEILHLDLDKTNVIDGQLVVMVRKKAMPIFYLRHWLVLDSYGDSLPELGHVVVVTVGAQKVGFVVDHLIGQEEVVIKPLGAMLQGTKGLAGATITGDGRIALILDVPGLMMVYAGRM